MFTSDEDFVPMLFPMIHEYEPLLDLVILLRTNLEELLICMTPSLIHLNVKGRVAMT